MAPKSALDNPPSASPSSSSSEEESEDSQQLQNPSDDSDRESSEIETADKPSAEKSDDEEDDDTVSEDTESDTSPSEFTVKPIVLKNPSASKSTPKHMAFGAKSAERKAKRVGDSVEKESNKKAKKDKALELVKDDANEIVVDKGVVGEGLKVDDEAGFWDKYPRLKEAIEVEHNESFFEVMEFHLTKMGHSKAKELDDKWKRYQVKETKLKLLKLKLVTKLTKVVLGELTKI